MAIIEGKLFVGIKLNSAVKDGCQSLRPSFARIAPSSSVTNIPQIISRPPSAPCKWNGS